jgi:hypothetical protein
VRIAENLEITLISGGRDTSILYVYTHDWRVL